MPQIQCSACAKNLKVADQAVGKKVKCPKCGHVFVVVDATSQVKSPVPAGGGRDAPADSRPVSFAGLRDTNRWSKVVIFAVTVRHEHVQTIDCAALKYRHQNLFLAITAAACQCRRVCKLVQKLRCGRHHAKTRQSDPACFQKISSVHNCLPSVKLPSHTLDAVVLEMVNFYFFCNRTPLIISFYRHYLYK